VRVFAALIIPQHVIQSITDWLEPLLFQYPSLKFVRGECMHLTLRFFGDIPNSRIESVKHILSEWNPGHLAFSLNSIGTFGKSSSPSVYWLGGRFPAEISGVAEELGQISDDRENKGKKNFIPHLTIARRKDSSIPPVFDPPDEITGVLREAAVINSRLTSSGPEYTFLERYSLN